MGDQTEAEKRHASAYGAVLFIGGMSLLVGLVAELFEIDFLQRLGHGWSSIVSGIIFVVLGMYVKRGSPIALGIAIGFYLLDGIFVIHQMIRLQSAPGIGGMIFRVAMLYLMFKGFGAIKEMKEDSRASAVSSRPFSPYAPHPSPYVPTPVYAPAPPPLPSPQAPAPNYGSAGAPPAPTTASGYSATPTSGLKAMSFVAPPQAANPEVKPDLVVKTIVQDIQSIRFVAYRAEIEPNGLRVIFQNGSQQELSWVKMAGIVIRQLPFNQPWDGKLLLDVVPSVVAGEKIIPIRILSTTYINYSFLPGGQSASTRENLRRLAAYAIAKNSTIFADPGTDYFVHGGQPPVRFVSIAQFGEYDSRYG